VLVRLRWHQPIRTTWHGRTAQGKTKKEIIRCLKRNLAGEVFGALKEIEEQPTTTS
jgi:transposase